MKTITINTAELSGVALDWAVAVAIGKQPVLWDFCFGNMDWQPQRCMSPFISVESDMARWSPSTDWAQGGPLIQSFMDVHEDISLFRRENEYFFADDDGIWGGSRTEFIESVSTLLIAACRAIVAAKLGSTVEVPAELVETAP